LKWKEYPVPKSIVTYDLTDAGRFGFEGLSASSGYERRYHLDDSRLVSPYGHTLPPVLADVLDIAASVLWADRHTMRSRDCGSFRQSRGWARCFHLILGVREPDAWRYSPVKEALEQLLTWLTEDQWHLDFERQQATRRQSDLMLSLFSSPPSDALVTLYSGGLDSLAGAIRLLQTYPRRPVVLVSAIHPRLSRIITSQVRRLQDHFGANRIQYAPLPFHIVHEARQNEEYTQRTRGFLFLAFGVAEAIACSASSVRTCENGIGMLNLPLNRRQLGTQHTRAMHPRTLSEMTRLLSLLDLNIRCEGPNVLRTKGELCTELRIAGLGFLCASTVSCDSFPLRLASTSPETERHCGTCTSCLLRRQAVFASHLQKEDASVYYEHDICQPLKSTQGRYLEQLKMMLDQVYLMKTAVASPQPDYALLQAFPELFEALQVVEKAPEAFGVSENLIVMQAFSDLIRRYTEEWDLFPYTLEPA
jgi:hypothetical protein